MAADYSLESKITEGKIAIVRNITVDFEQIRITFENISTKERKELIFEKVIEFSMKADCGINYDPDMDIMAYRTLIGFGRERLGTIYEYVMKTDDYEFIIKNLKDVSLIKVV